MFWPFILEPAMAGTTYNIIDKYVDTEKYYTIMSLNLKGDGLHDVACKAIIAAHKDIQKSLES